MMKQSTVKHVAPEVDTSVHPWSVSLDRAAARDVAREARAQARHTGQPALASLTLPVAWHDPLALWAAARQARLDRPVYWEAPREPAASDSPHSSALLAIVGIGVAAEIATDDPRPFPIVASRWRDLVRDAAIHATPSEPLTPASGLAAFGGFAFDPLSPRSDLWVGFPAGALVVPRVQVACGAGVASLTVNALVGPEDDTDAIAGSLETLVARLCSAVAHLTPPDDAPNPLALADLRPASEWQALASDATAAIRAEEYDKIVLARGVRARGARRFDLAATLARLRRAYPTAYVFAVERDGQTFAGATPELLARSRGGEIATMALAGTAPRGATPDEDAALGAELASAEKTRGEHAIVVESIRAALAPLCRAISAPAAPHLARLANVQHLRTPITAELAPGASVLDVVAALHPTPAVGGWPRDAALAAIRAREGLDRGWFAGPLGWLSASGDGDFVVALRSALVAGDTATLFAGCGIVAGSDPAAEYRETCLKLDVMRRGLSGEEDAP